MTTIKYYVQHIYGCPREKFVDKAQEAIFQRLTGRKTLDSVSRELIRDLSGRAVEFEQVLPPVWFMYLLFIIICALLIAIYQEKNK